MISTPTANSFAHVAHVGAKKMPPLAGLEADYEGTWTLVAAENPDDGVATLLEQNNVVNEYLKASPVIKVEDNSHIRELCILRLPLLLSSALAKPRKIRRKPSPKVPV